MLTAKITNLVSFSDFAIAKNSVNYPLPIELLYFNAEVLNEHVLLSWATASEINNDFFTIERTADMQNISKIATISGAGNSNITCNYSYTDYNPLTGISYYRLKQTDYDGSYEYSEWEAVNFSEKAEGLKIVYLHNDNGIASVGIKKGEESLVNIKAYDIFGRLVHSNTINVNEPMTNYKFDPGTTSGKMLIIQIYDNKDSETRKGMFYR